MLASRMRDLVRDIGALVGFLGRASRYLHSVEGGLSEVRAGVDEVLGRAIGMVLEIERKSLEVLSEAYTSELPPHALRRVSEVVERALDALRRVREIVGAYLESVRTSRHVSTGAVRAGAIQSLEGLEEYLRRYMDELQRTADLLESHATPAASQ